MLDSDIRSAIDGGRLAAANREIASKLKRFPNKSYYQALNAYYLFASGNTSGALEACNSLKEKVPSDPEALDLLSETFSRLLCKPQATEVYENAVKKYPSTELILVWFNKALAQFDTRTLQRAAMLLQKHAKSSRQYTLWAALAGYLWGCETSLDKERLMQLALAQGLVEKVAPAQRNDELYLYAQILAKQGAYDRVVEVLRPLQHRQLELVLLYLEALDKTALWDALYKECHELLFVTKFDDFDTWKYLVKAAHKLDMPRLDVDGLVELTSRNAYMANIEVAKVYGDGVAAAVDKYYLQFHSKPCCSLDLSTVELSEEFHTTAAERRKALLEMNLLTAKEAATLMNLVKLQHTPVEWAEVQKFDNPELADLYIASMIELLRGDLSTKSILTHVVRLEHFAEADPENFKIKLWLLNLYSTLSASQLSLKTYKDLKIKMVQHDIVAYKLNLEPTAKNLNELVQIYRFYLTAESEVLRNLEEALKKGLYTKLEDIYTFGQRMRLSLALHLLVVNLLRMLRMLNNDFYRYFHDWLKTEKANIVSDAFFVSDNRDFSTDYKLGMHVKALPLFDAEARKGKEYVRLYLVKELLLNEDNEGECAKLLKLLTKWLSNPAYTKQLSPYEAHQFKLYLALFKVCKGPAAKDRAEQTSFLVKNLDFAKVELKFLAKTSPLASSANSILVDTLEMVKSISTLSKEPQILALAKKLQAGMVAYMQSKPEMDFFREVTAEFAVDGLPKGFVAEQLERLEDGLARSAFKIR